MNKKLILSILSLICFLSFGYSSPKNETFIKEKLNDYNEYKIIEKDESYKYFSEDFYVRVFSDIESGQLFLCKYETFDKKEAEKLKYPCNKIIKFSRSNYIPNFIDDFQISFSYDLKVNELTIYFTAYNSILKKGSISNKDKSIIIQGEQTNQEYLLKFVMTKDNYDTYSTLINSDSIYLSCNDKKIKADPETTFMIKRYISIFPELDKLKSDFTNKKNEAELIRIKKLSEEYYQMGYLCGSNKTEKYSKDYKHAKDWGEPDYCVDPFIEGYEKGRKEYLSTLDLSGLSVKEKAAIEKEDIFIGMSEEAMLISLGKPQKINRTVTENKTSKQFIFKSMFFKFVYTENGKVVSWQD